jgi:ribosomal protein S18 acetylase RimI-like enzyme
VRDDPRRVEEAGVSGAVTVQSVTRVTPALLEGLQRLLPQLSAAPAPDAALVEELISSASSTVVVAHAEGKLLGVLVLAVFPTLTGRRAWIEDVVVDEAARGQGVGAALVREALRLAADADVRSVELTSRPSRTAANRLYRRLGFEPRETTVYRFTG